MNLTPYKFSDNELKRLKTEYLLIIENVNLSAIDKNNLEKITDNYGVYFWLMNYENQPYKIYIGKTKDLKRRINEYKSNFQIHSPNDFKLRFFQDFMNKYLNSSSLDLYFMKCQKDDYTEKETNAINLFNPIINVKSQTSDKIKDKMRQCFQEYYEDTFLNKLNK